MVAAQRSSTTRFVPDAQRGPFVQFSDASQTSGAYTPRDDVDPGFATAHSTGAHDRLREIRLSGGHLVRTVSLIVCNDGGGEYQRFDSAAAAYPATCSGMTPP